MAPSFDKGPKTIGAPTRLTNLDEHGHALPQISNAANRRLCTRRRISRRLDYEQYLGYSGKPPPQRAGITRPARGKLLTNACLRLRHSPRRNRTSATNISEHGRRRTLSRLRSAIMGLRLRPPASEGEGRQMRRGPSTRSKIWRSSSTDPPRQRNTLDAPSIHPPASSGHGPGRSRRRRSKRPHWKKISALSNDLSRSYIDAEEYIIRRRLRCAGHW